MTPSDILQASCDSALPLGALGAALAAQLRPSRPNPVRVRVKTWKPKGIQTRMAAIMIERRRAAGCCLRNDLIAAGFSPCEIELHGHAATAQAAQRWRLAEHDD